MNGCLILSYAFPMSIDMVMIFLHSSVDYINWLFNGEPALLFCNKSYLVVTYNVRYCILFANILWRNFCINVHERYLYIFFL